MAFTLVGTDVNNCSNTSSVTVVADAIPVASITVSTPTVICSGEIASLSFTTNVAGATASWSRTVSGISTSSTFPAAGATTNVSGTLVNAGDQNQQPVIVSVSFTGLGPAFCVGASVEDTILVNPIPPVPTVIASEENYVTNLAVDSICHSSSNLNFGADSSFLNAHSAYSLFYHWSTTPDQLISYTSKNLDLTMR